MYDRRRSLTGVRPTGPLHLGHDAGCSSQCPPCWWNPDKFVGPAGLIQTYRFIVDSRDRASAERLDDLNDAYRLIRCRTIMNCAEVPLYRDRCDGENGSKR